MLEESCAQYQFLLYLVKILLNLWNVICSFLISFLFFFHCWLSLLQRNLNSNINYFLYITRLIKLLFKALFIHYADGFYVISLHALLIVCVLLASRCTCPLLLSKIFFPFLCVLRLSSLVPRDDHLYQEVCDYQVKMSSFCCFYLVNNNLVLYCKWFLK